jgi:hypothetical protein
MKTSSSHLAHHAASAVGIKTGSKTEAASLLSVSGEEKIPSCVLWSGDLGALSALRGQQSMGSR